VYSLPHFEGFKAVSVACLIVETALEVKDCFISLPTPPLLIPPYPLIVGSEDVFVVASSVDSAIGLEAEPDEGGENVGMEEGSEETID
jgi:hypothetical protein